MLHSLCCSLLACAAATLAASTTSVVSAAPLELYGINYNMRTGPDWAPANEKCKTEGDVDDDLKTIATITKRIRIFSLSDCNQGAVVLAAASRHGLQVQLGLWVNSDVRVFQAEKLQLDVLRRSGLISTELVTAIHVGSEAVYRKEVTSTQIIGYMKEIKAMTTTYWPSIPVTIADIGDVYLAHTDLIDAVDFVSANGFPFWEKKAVDGAADYFHERMAQLMELTAKQNKDFVISETGWASQGSHVNASVASPANAARYLSDFHALATKHQWKYYYFEAFDEPWKLQVDPTNTVEAYFGIFNADRTLKAEFADVVKADSASSTNSTSTTGSSQESASAGNGTTAALTTSVPVPGSTASLSPYSSPSPSLPATHDDCTVV